MQCFVVQSDEIEGRLDPSPYHPVRIDAIKKIKSTNTGLLPLKDVVIFKKEIITSNPSGLPYIGLENIESNMGILIPSKDTKESFGSACTFKKGDILFPKLRPYLNKVYLAEFDGVCSTEFHILKAKKCNSRYLFSFLSSDLVVNQTSYLMTGNALPRLQTDQIKELLIPLPSDEIQNAIDNFIQSAYNQKKQKEAEAQSLLDSIDGYVLDELGIKLPELKDKMCFVVSSEEVHDNRVDAYYYQPRFIKLIKALQKAPFEINSLEKISTKIINGLDFREFAETGIPYLRVSNIKPNSFDLTDVKFIPAFSISKDIELDSGDLLITRKGTYGVAVVVDDEHKRMVISSEIFRIVLKKDNVNSHYVSIWLNSNIAKQLFDRISTGGIMGHLSQDALRNIQIPLPPLKIQNKIADEVKRRISEAERLKAEASKIIEAAKKKVEEMILGD